MSTISGLPARAGSANAIGILCVTAAGACYTLNDACLKWLSGDYALHQLTFVRSLVAILFTVALFVPFEGSFSVLRTRRPFWHLLRGMLVVTGNIAFFLGMAALPLADVTAVYFVAPLIITALSVVILGENVGWRRWLAVAVGFTGVVLVIRPGSDAFRLVALLPLVTASLNAVLHITTRKLGATERASALAFYIHLTFLVFSALFGLAFGSGWMAGSNDASLEFLFRAWSWPRAADVPVMLMSGVFVACGTFLIAQGFRIAQAGIAAPFEYAAIPTSIIAGILLWGDWPAPLAWIGIVLIIGSGIFIFLRETMQGHAGRWKLPWRRSG